MALHLVAGVTIILPKTRAKLKMLAGLALLALASPACVYRFTNIATRPPAGVASVAVEAVYDTSREVIPHELMWEALQRAFAENGRLMLVPADEADALVRVHLTNAVVRPSGGKTETGLTKDRKGSAFNPDAPPAQNFKNLGQASEYTTEESVSFVVNVEVVNLKTREVIKTTRYAESAAYKSFRSASVAHPDTQYLLFEEALQTKMRDLSQRVARKIVADFFL